MGPGTILSPVRVQGTVSSNPFRWFFFWSWVVFSYTRAQQYSAKYIRDIYRYLEITLVQGSSLWYSVLRFLAALIFSLVSQIHLFNSGVVLASSLVFFLSAMGLEAGTVIGFMSSVSHFLGFA